MEASSGETLPYTALGKKVMSVCEGRVKAGKPGTHSTCCKRRPRRKSLTDLTSANSSLEGRSVAGAPLTAGIAYEHAIEFAFCAVRAWRVLAGGGEREILEIALDTANRWVDQPGRDLQ